MILAIRDRMEKREEGFTLIELLVVVIIIGILAAIAIPVFLNQRQKAWDSAAQQSLRSAATYQEMFYTDGTAYSVNKAGLVAQGYRDSDGVELTITTNTGASQYCMTAKHGSSDNTYSLGNGIEAKGSPKLNGTCTNGVEG